MHTAAPTKTDFNLKILLLNTRHTCTYPQHQHLLYLFNLAIITQHTVYTGSYAVCRNQNAAELLSADWGTVPVAVQTASPDLLDTARNSNRFKLPKHVNRSCVSPSPRALRPFNKHATRRVNLSTPPPPPPGRPSNHSNWCDRVLPTAARSRGGQVSPSENSQ